MADLNYRVRRARSAPSQGSTTPKKRTKSMHDDDRALLNINSRVRSLLFVPLFLRSRKLPRTTGSNTRTSSCYLLQIHALLCRYSKQSTKYTYYCLESVSNMPSPYPSNEKGSSEDSKKASSSSWFSSWFENDNSNWKQEIHHKLNEFDDYQQRYEQQDPSSVAGSGGGGVAGNHHATGREGQPTTSLQQEMEEFFESAGLGGIPQWTSSSTTSSSTSSSFRGQGGGRYQMMRKENQNGVQIDVQFPRAIDPNSVTVEVLQESPCVVQWRNINASSEDGKSGRALFRDRARLGESIDCSKLSASISSAQNNMLTVKAPRHSSASARQEKPRVVPVTERDE
jgi:hypothetical protein